MPPFASGPLPLPGQASSLERPFPEIWTPIFLRLRLPPFPGKIVEHAQLVAVQIGDPELAQAPRFILRLSNDLRPSLPPTMVQFVDFVLTGQIQPDYNRPATAVLSAE